MTEETSPARRIPLRYVVGVVLVLGVAAIVVPARLWWVGHHATLEVGSVTGVPHCAGTRPTTHESPDESSAGAFEEVVVPLREGFSCTFTVRVSNAGDHGVTLGRVTVPVAGPGGGAGFEVRTIDGRSVARGDAIDAAVDLGVELEPGASFLMDLDVVFRESGCTSEGGVVWVDPVLRVEGLLASRDLAVTDLPGFLGTAASSCDS